MLSASGTTGGRKPTDNSKRSEREDRGEAQHGKGAGEQPGWAPREYLERALESIEKAEGDGIEDIHERWRDTLDHSLRAAGTTTRRAACKIEKAVYEQVMTRFTPYYFDNELVTANIRQTTRLETDDGFVFEVNVNDDELKGDVGQRLDRSNGTGQESP